MHLLKFPRPQGMDKDRYTNHGSNFQLFLCVDTFLVGFLRVFWGWFLLLLLFLPPGNSFNLLSDQLGISKDIYNF